MLRVLRYIPACSFSRNFTGLTKTCRLMQMGEIRLNMRNDRMCGCPIWHDSTESNDKRSLLVQPNKQNEQHNTGRKINDERNSLHRRCRFININVTSESQVQYNVGFRNLENKHEKNPTRADDEQRPSLVVTGNRRERRPRADSSFIVRRGQH